jgi:large subunit ribosomal protein L18
MNFNRKEQRALRHRRLRQRIKGTAARPRMAICISNKHMYVQFIDDDAMCTLAATTTLNAGKSCNIETAKLVGEQAAGVAKEKGISLVVVDRGGHKFHGRVKQIVDSAVGAGLKITEKADKPAEETK